MPSKSFKDYYKEDATGEQVAKEYVARPSRAEPQPQLQETPSVSIQRDVPKAVPGTEKEVISEEVVDQFKKILAEQRKENEKILKSTNETSERLIESFGALVEQTNKTNEMLLEAIQGLTEQVGTLEKRLDELNDLEIPTPIVNLQMPGKKVVKEVKRDKRGMITHIEEHEVFDDEETGEE